MIRITMFSSADKVAGQGVGSAYSELINLLRKYHAKELEVKINQYYKTDISHYHTINPTFFLSTFFKKRFGRRIGYVHFLPSTLKGSIHLPSWIESLFYSYIVTFYKRMDHLVVVNPSFIEELTNYGIVTENISYIPNFVSKEKFYPIEAEKMKKKRDSLDIPENKFVVLGAGQIQERKGVLDFIKLAKEMPEVQFIWLGGFSFGKITDGYDKFNKLIEQSPENLWFPGIINREDMCSYYNLADVFLLPSFDELFPMCILEAFSCDKPVILRDLALYLPILEGYYEPASDRKEMKKIIRKMMSSSDYYQDLVQKSIAGSKIYSEERLAKIWLDFYRQQAKIR
ncbi:glycosyltransferase family 4 protein [Carnobacterium funditum]|uniref:glycosyltransferase family 4 protein n=1 Tax=Carnobacterium funditum TaxID=2752 RepID=UPI000550C267|nr:glycosyltransferase family 4 protein [Carnobacterium funditum]